MTDDVEFPEQDVIRVIHQVKLLLRGQVLSVDQIFYLVPRLMQIVENYKTISGVQKKMVIVKAMNKVADELLSDESPYKVTVLDVINNAMPIFIDTLVSVDKREIRIKINSWINWIKETFCCCCCCLSMSTIENDLQ